MSSQRFVCVFVILPFHLWTVYTTADIYTLLPHIETKLSHTRWYVYVVLLPFHVHHINKQLTYILVFPRIEPTNDVDLDTLRALEGYLDNYKGVLVIVSHDRQFTDKVTDHLFVFEGNGVVKDYQGSLSDYAECLVEQENASDQSQSNTGGDKKGNYKEDKQKRNERRNAIKKMKRELGKIEPATEKLKAKAVELQSQIDNSSEEGWTVLADLTEKLQKINEEVDEKEMEWLELAEELETLEQEEAEQQ